MGATDATVARLPFRIAPRRRVQLGRIAAWVAAAIGCFVVMAVDLQKHQTAVAHYVAGSYDPWFEWKLYLVGGAVLLFALWQIARAIAKLLPGNPYYYLRVTADGLEVATPFRTRRLAWSELGAFSVQERTIGRRFGRQVIYFVTASPAAPRSAAESTRYVPTAVQISPDEYGTESGQEDAEALAAWFNRLRLASLKPGSMTDVPAAFEHSIKPDKVGKPTPSRSVAQR